MSLHKAIKHGHLNVAVELIKGGADVNKLKLGAVAPLHHAIRLNSLVAVKLLLDHGADVNVKGIYGITPLHLVGWEDIKENYAIIRLLLERGANCNDRAINGMTPFLVALSWRSLKVIKLFLEHGADITAVCSTGCNALFYAVRNSHLDVIEFILDQRFDIEWRNHVSNRSVLEHAVSYGNADACALLIQCGAVCNTGNSVDDHTPLSLAVTSERKNPRVVQLLLENGANVVDKVGGRSILEMAAARENNEAIVNLVIRQLAKLVFMKCNIFNEDRLLIETIESYKLYYQTCMQSFFQQYGED